MRGASRPPHTFPKPLNVQSITRCPQHPPPRRSQTAAAAGRFLLAAVAASLLLQVPPASARAAEHSVLVESNEFELDASTTESADAMTQEHERSPSQEPDVSSEAPSETASEQDGASPGSAGRALGESRRGQMGAKDLEEPVVDDQG